MKQDHLEDYEETQEETKIKTTNTAKFTDFLLKEELLQSIKEFQFEHPSEVQQKTIPKAILNVDILCQAKSGMGKTAVFVISTLQQLNYIENEIQILVLVNTKEMAHQIYKEYERFIKNLENVKVDYFSGGNPIHEDVEKLRVYPTIFIGTPGRTLDLLKRKEISLRHVKHFVLDEADHQLQDLSSRWIVQQIFMSTPFKKQSMFFSATFNDYTKEEALKFLKNPHVIIIGDESNLVLHGLRQFYIKVDNKVSMVEKIIDSLKFNQCVIFLREKSDADMLERYLKKNSFPAVAIHSGLQGEERIQRKEDFKKLKYRILVTTNLLSRGIDIQDINLVINYDMPENTETYLHRIGRAGRFDTQGMAISFIKDDKDVIMLNEVQKRFEVEIKEYKFD
ncbi:hypothetical protein H312_01714 [Anncaliia algerae PRA339]|uniref:RNA helicase n=1 Tax=Anncaliia algerae PRA339 TaxID=1288291 RepID=A0A059F1M6_9MICR|nr:hypothetical protein H312_01714 [Anncaliia algerae PRA339]